MSDNHDLAARLLGTKKANDPLLDKQVEEESIEEVYDGPQRLSRELQDLIKGFEKLAKRARLISKRVLIAAGDLPAGKKRKAVTQLGGNVKEVALQTEDDIIRYIEKLIPDAHRAFNLSESEPEDVEEAEKTLYNIEKDITKTLKSFDGGYTHGLKEVGQQVSKLTQDFMRSDGSNPEKANEAAHFLFAAGQSLQTRATDLQKDLTTLKALGLQLARRAKFLSESDEVEERDSVETTTLGDLLDES